MKGMAFPIGEGPHGQPSDRVLGEEAEIRGQAKSWRVASRVRRTLSTLKSKHIEIRVRDKKLISEEAEWAYKNVDNVVHSIEGAKISNIVAKMVPIGVTKG